MTVDTTTHSPETLVFRKRTAGSWLRSVALAVLLFGAASSFGLWLFLPYTWLWYLISGPLEFTPNFGLTILFVTAFCELFFVPMLIYAAWGGSSLVLKRAEARAVNELDRERLGNVVEEVALAAGVTTPKVMIIADRAPNAMAAGRGRRNATVVVTTGLLELLNRQQLQAVVAHEIAHVVNSDIWFDTFLSANCSFYDNFYNQVRWQSANDKTSRNWWFLLFLPTWICAGLTRLSGMAASRQREILADDTAVKLTRDPKALIAALRAIATSERQLRVSRGLVNLLILDPEDPESTESTWRRSHPPLAERVFRLEELAEKNG
jgi:heat shock protein HtpX